MKKKQHYLASLSLGIVLFVSIIGIYFWSNTEVFSAETPLEAQNNMPTPVGILKKNPELTDKGALNLDFADTDRSIGTPGKVSKLYINEESKDKGHVYVKVTNVKESDIRVVVVLSSKLNEVGQEMTRSYKEGYYPLISGSGEYFLLILARNEKDLFNEVHRVIFHAQFSKEDAFSYSNVNSIYTEESELAKKAYELAGNLNSNKAKANKIEKYIRKNYQYDETFPDDEEIMQTADHYFNQTHGVCYHFSSLFSSMMKSIGVPTREVRGWSDFTDKYHSWNEYLNEDGEWVLIDPTFKRIINGKYDKDPYTER